MCVGCAQSKVPLHGTHQTRSHNQVLPVREVSAAATSKARCACKSDRGTTDGVPKTCCMHFTWILRGIQGPWYSGLSIMGDCQRPRKFGLFIIGFVHSPHPGASSQAGFGTWYNETKTRSRQKIALNSFHNQAIKKFETIGQRILLHPSRTPVCVNTRCQRGRARFFRGQNSTKLLRV